MVPDVRRQLLLCDKLYRLKLAHDDLDGRFLIHMLGSGATRYQFEQEATGASGSMQNISQDAVLNLWIHLPPRHEQSEIVAFIDSRIRRIDRAAAKIHEGIDRLKEFRTALISAAVTGKIDVRDEVP